MCVFDIDLGAVVWILRAAGGDRPLTSSENKAECTGFQIDAAPGYPAHRPGTAAGGVGSVYPGGIRQMPSLAGADKRIGGTNRYGDSHYETVTLVEHGSGTPKASCSFHNANEALDATR